MAEPETEIRNAEGTESMKRSSYGATARTS